MVLTENWYGYEGNARYVKDRSQSYPLEERLKDLERCN